MLLSPSVLGEFNSKVSITRRKTSRRMTYSAQPIKNQPHFHQ